jgi:hypothetical protein
METSVFHMRTRLLPGTTQLLPVDALREIDPEAHARAIAKYDDTPERQRLRDTEIPGLGRCWTGVVFLSPIHPHALWKTWHDAGGAELPPTEFWRVPVATLPEGCVVFDRQVSSTGEPIDPTEVTPLDPDAFRTAFETTPGNKEWLEEGARHGQRGAFFNRTPHVLSPEPVDLTDAEIIRWDEPFEAGDH